MAEPLKNSFGPDVPVKIADDLSAVHQALDTESFIEYCLEGYGDLELMDRARRIADGLAIHLPEDRGRALHLIGAALGDEIDSDVLTGMEPFAYMPYVVFVAEHGLDHFEVAMRLQYELTKRFTAEFSIRAYLEHHPKRTLDRLTLWASDPNVHVRRLVSEGTRPRLPWAPRLRPFQEDPTPVIGLLETLKDDPAEYVRRSVANNLNDISKDHPDTVVELARRWWDEGDANRRRLIRHGLRTLIKAGHEGALAVLGYTSDTPARIADVTVDPPSVRIGEKVRITADIANPASEGIEVLVDLVVHFVKANGSTGRKVFKGSELEIEPGRSAQVRKTISLAQHTTRTHYAGTHTVDVLINGVTHPGPTFEVYPSNQS